MKKLVTILPIIVLLVVAIPVFAANTDQGTQQKITPSPSGNAVQNQNQVKTQNEGEDSNLQINTQEQEEQGGEQEDENRGMPKDIPPRSEEAQEHISTVSAKVEELLTTKSLRGGIGEQVKEIAQDQQSAQEEIQAELRKIDGRSGLLKSLIGPDFKALKNMQNVMEQNRLRIEQLTTLQNQLTNRGDIAQVEEMIQVLTDQNMSLQDRVGQEERGFSMFGWFFRLFN